MTWNLDGYYLGPEDPALARDRRWAIAEASRLRDLHAGHLATLAPAALRDALGALEAVRSAAGRAEDYAFLRVCADAGDEAARTLHGACQADAAAAREALAFFEPELQALAPDRLAALVEAPDLAGYRDWLARLARLAAHRLPDAEARMAAQKDLTGVEAWRALYARTQAEMLVDLPEEGALPLGRVATRTSGPDRDARRAASQAIHEAQGRHAPALVAAFNAVMGDEAAMAARRGFPSVLAAQLAEEGLAPAAVEALLVAVEGRTELVGRYYRLKARWLGLAGFAAYDTPAPVTADAPAIPYEQAQAWVLDAFDAFAPRSGQLARRFFADRRIDPFPRPGKREAGFCIWSHPDVHPVLLLNYAGRPTDVLTLAHELGHGVHYALINEARHTPLNVRSSAFAETPSTFAELLVLAHLRRSAADPQARRQVLAAAIEAALGAIFVQVQLARWEQAAYAARAAGPVPAEVLCDLWLDGRRRLYGPDVVVPAWARWGWLRHMHAVHLPMFTYRYAFGMLLGFALHRRAEAEGASFAETWLATLAGGVAASADAIAAPLGADVHDPALWMSGLDQVAALIAEAEALG